MKKLLLTLALLGCTQSSTARLGALGPVPPGGPFHGITWGAFTVDAGGVPCMPLDAGAGTFTSDPIVMGGYLNASESGATFFCVSPGDGGSAAGGALEDSLTAFISNDGNTWAAAAPPATMLIDGGIGDAGTPGWVQLGTQSASYAALQLTRVAAQNALVCCNVTTVQH